jgi:hypothetical protein
MTINTGSLFSMDKLPNGGAPDIRHGDPMPECFYFTAKRRIGVCPPSNARRLLAEALLDGLFVKKNRCDGQRQSEAPNRLICYGCSPQHLNIFCPFVLPRNAVTAIPYLFYFGVRPEKVDMPVRPTGRPEMVRQSPTQTTAPTSTADIDVESRLELQRSEFANLDSNSLFRGEE